MPEVQIRQRAITRCCQNRYVLGLVGSGTETNAPPTESPKQLSSNLLNAQTLIAREKQLRTREGNAQVTARQLSYLSRGGGTYLQLGGGGGGGGGGQDNIFPPPQL